MSEQDKQVVTEPSASKQPDSPSDASNTEEAGFSISDFKGEESKSEPIPVKEEAKGSNVAEEQRQKQISTWETRYANGEVSLDDIPKWVQREIDNRESGVSTKKDVDYEQLARETVKQEFAQREDNDKFNSLTRKLEGIKVSKDQKERLMNRFNGLKGKLMQGEALEIAIEAAGINFSAPESEKRVPNSMKPPATATKEHSSGIPDDITWKQAQKTYSEDERRKNLMSALGR